MARDELVAYFNAGGDVSELMRDATAGPDIGPAPPPEAIPMIDEFLDGTRAKPHSRKRYPS